jgi:glycine hydroxymethyltransferase
METIAGFVERILVRREDPEAVGKDAIDFRLPYQTIYYSFEEGLPPAAESSELSL